MTAQDGATRHRRGRDGGALVYPVYSRRSGGLSLGVNLFPESKACGFDCPYCEVMEIEGGGPFSLSELDDELADFLDRSYPLSFAAEPIRDICLSGNGEPTLYPRLGEAIALCAEARRRRPGLLSQAELVLITNSAGFLSGETAASLHRAVADEGLVIWAKLDAGTPAVFRRMSRSTLGFEELVDGIKAFAMRSPIVLQTMLCAVGDLQPQDGEAAALAELVAAMVGAGAKIPVWQLYTQARPSTQGQSSPVSDSALAALARTIASSLGGPRAGDSGAGARGPWPRLRVYGRSGELFPFAEGPAT